MPGPNLWVFNMLTDTRYTSPQGTVSYTRTVTYVVRSDLSYIQCICFSASLKTRLAGLGCLPGNVSGRIHACASCAHRTCRAASRGLSCKSAPWPSVPVPTTREGTLKPERGHCLRFLPAEKQKHGTCPLQWLAAGHQRLLQAPPGLLFQ